MKKHLLTFMFISAIVSIALSVNELNAQPMTKLTVPDYSYGTVYSTYGKVRQDGVETMGNFWTFEGELEGAAGAFLAHGFRWWGYSSASLLICGDPQNFNYPGYHGVWDMSSLGCMNPPIGYHFAWGGVIADPANRQIRSLTGSVNQNGPTAPYCIQIGFQQICYPIPSLWGFGSSHGYLRKVVVVQSTGILQDGDPVDINASITTQGVFEGDGTASGAGVLLLNKRSETPWYRWGMGREYLRWGDVEDILGTSELRNNMLGNLMINLNNTDDTTATVAIGDTVIVEVVFRNTISHANPGEFGEAEGWAGEKPTKLFSNVIYTRTDSIKSLINKHGNTLTYDLISLTPGAVLEPVNPGGPNLDTDVDGISDAREKGPDGNDETFDGNADGIPDWEQANASSFRTFDGQNYVTIVVPVGTELSQLLVTDNPSPLDAPEEADFPYGFFDFSIDGLEPGESIVVTLILHTGETVDTYYKYGLTPVDPTPHWYEFMYDGQTGAQISGPVINLHFTDGLRGDEDITVNGSIKEPGGPSKSVTTGMSEFIGKKGAIVVYPNPSTDYITLKTNNIKPADYILKIYSITGKIIKEEILSVPDASFEYTVPTGNLLNGIYMITLSGNNISYKTKFLIQN